MSGRKNHHVSVQLYMSDQKQKLLIDILCAVLLVFYPSTLTAESGHLRKYTFHFECAIFEHCHLFMVMISLYKVAQVKIIIYFQVEILESG